MKTSYKIMLIVSLIFNLAFIGTFLYMRTMFFKPFRDGIKKEFGEKEWFGELSETHKMTMDMGRKVHEFKRDFFRKLSEEQLDENKTREIMDEFINMQIQFERTLGEKLIHVRKMMSREDAAKFFTHPRFMPEDKPPFRDKDHFKEKKQFKNRDPR